MNVAELIAREHIRELVARYNAFGDAGRVDDVAGLFAEDGHLHVSDPTGSVTVRGRSQIARLLTDVKASWSRDDEPCYVRHYVSTHIIGVTGEDIAHGSAHVLVLRPGGTVTSGRYFDRYRRDGDRWLFAHRRAHADSPSVAATLAARSPACALRDIPEDEPSH
ncbi:nuclear transport factor 2 family protein [Mycolicibacterium sp. P9-22]|uniref:nuclear transport factor 2 family protein n=1 Tax=Mycolicibacterium sp. P9-22 TaxID=2024613 RepID=UPI0011EC5CBC|nr:nuclear transport factor 2 family protein [Mycolicibacterium sp. P9-22]KAA0120646.1 nuclear transport factor 2 family protein [Mycolicibacterium sp. P9-22]